MATYEHTPMGRGYETFFGYYHHANDYYTEKIGATSVGILQDVCQRNGFELVDLWDTTRPAIGIYSSLYTDCVGIVVSRTLK